MPDVPVDEEVSVQDAVRVAAARIGASGVGDTARLDAELLVGHVTGYDRVGLRVHGQEPLGAAHATALEPLVERRCGGEPIAYIVGTAWFYGLRFHVDRRVLVPRPETEALVDAAMAHMKHHWLSVSGGPLVVVDACTGSGCVATAIAAEADFRIGPGRVRVVGTDISADALEVARENAASNEVDVTFLQGDLLEPVRTLAPVDVVVANPPYVLEDAGAELDSSVRAHEPHVALFAPESHGGVEGMYGRLVRQASKLLVPRGLLAVEHGQGQRAQVVALVEEHGFTDVRGMDDLAGIDRIVTGLAPLNDRTGRPR